MELKYNYFFYANACHVCKHFGQEVSLKRCGNCTMIAYCSKEHQREHWSQHKDLCNAICNILKDNKMLNLLNNTPKFNTEKWTQMKMNFMLLVAIRIPRKLEQYEEQMFKFLRSCTVCHDQTAKVLVDCPSCPNTSFCIKHKNNTEHKKLCYLFQLCFKLDILSTIHERKMPKWKIPYDTNYINLSENMKDFINHYIEQDLYLSIEEETMINAEYLTRPLTFLYALHKLGYSLRNNNIVIHIIGANVMELDGIELWEILLHWLPNLMMINLVLIGPELSPGFISLNLCEYCKCRNKQLLIQMHNIFYENYVYSDSYIKPNFIVGYNVGIHECDNLKNDTWSQSVQLISKQNCPFLLTSYTLSEAKKEHTRLNMILNNDIKYIYFEKNPYSSLRPYRDFETEGMYYQNDYMIIYENL